MTARRKQRFHPSEHHAIWRAIPSQLIASIVANLRIKIAAVEGLQARPAAKTMAQTR